MTEINRTAENYPTDYVPKVYRLVQPLGSAGDEVVEQMADLQAYQATTPLTYGLELQFGEDVEDDDGNTVTSPRYVVQIPAELVEDNPDFFELVSNEPELSATGDAPYQQ